MTALNFLILDDADSQSVAGSVSFSSFVDPSVDANLFIITSRKAGVSATNKQQCIAYVELKCPTLDGSVEMIARGWHNEHTIYRIYCRQEDFLLRAAHLRWLLGIREGMEPENTS
ncbi:hypothetical protein AMAG_14270 [Allomyces macrogynus ATCC 38327]|uniref:Uncharacterized protein n=1 Tax=Allomyces macrogynus (strain ATCC 38327) TaxID=578462 RepID=A0A0L0T4Q1_ALLM3|nr:hypothetical protein AMAG_14270 [Allomyces macrogynus ATCC 38327]|eukprot:KNE69725.1 hypothetical protein AMAG_14270 [Allomyces macrogynus ATCC 38327]